MREPPKAILRVGWYVGAVDQEEQKGAGGPNLEGHLEVVDRWSLSLHVNITEW